MIPNDFIETIRSVKQTAGSVPAVSDDNVIRDDVLHELTYITPQSSSNDPDIGGYPTERVNRNLNSLLRTMLID